MRLVLLIQKTKQILPDKPQLIDIYNDFESIYFEYSKYWNFWEDYKSLPFKEFYIRVFHLKGEVADLIRARKILLGEEKTKDKDLKKWARQFETEEIKEWRAKERKKVDIDKALGVINNIDNLMLKNRERRLNEKKRGSKWQQQMKK